ncbi:uncharacterized protein, partial [Penaeus vannamei]|uniref:uncharacterized protein n=1 Tax=Penaeus vannamei TaxID=6689 RepID=UPI00387F950B
QLTIFPKTFLPQAAFSAATLLTGFLTGFLAAAARADAEGASGRPREGVERTVFAPPGASGYGFEYSVVDSTASWMHSRGEWSDGVSTHGAYHVQLPDGRVQRVSYTADEHGFRPVITYEEPHGYAGGFGWKVGGGSGLGMDVLEVDGLGAKEENGLGGRPHPGKDQVDVESRDVDEGHGGDIHPGEVYPGHGRGGRGHPRSDFVPVVYRQSYEPYAPYHDPPYYGSEPRRTYPSYRESPHAKVTHHGSPRGFPNHVGSPHHPRPAHDDPRHHVMHTTLKPRTYHINKTPAVGTRKPTNGHSKSHRLLTKEDKTPKGEMAGGHDPMEAHDMREEGHEVLTTLAPRLSMNDPIYRHDYSPMSDHDEREGGGEESGEGDGEESEEEEEEEEGEEDEMKNMEDEGMEEEEGPTTTPKFVRPTYLQNALTPTPSYRPPSPAPYGPHSPYPHLPPHYPPPPPPHHHHMYPSPHTYHPSAPSPHHLTHALPAASYPYPYPPPHNPHSYPLPTSPSPPLSPLPPSHPAPSSLR